MAALAQSVVQETLRFVENGAGTYTGTVVIPAEAILIDVIVHGEALWAAATSASLTVGDSVTPAGFYAATSLKATDLLAGESFSLAQPGGLYGSDYAPNDGTALSAILGLAGQMKRRKLSVERTLQAVVVSIGAGTTGRTEVCFVYALPSKTVITQ